MRLLGGTPHMVQILGDRLFLFLIFLTFRIYQGPSLNQVLLLEYFYLSLDFNWCVLELHSEHCETSLTCLDTILECWDGSDPR